MAHILHQAIGGPGMMAFWYHFAILFEALFILTAVDAGTRAGRFKLQDLLGTFAPSLKRTDSLPANLIATALCVAAWGYFLYQGVVDPLGGINTLWPLFGIANQMLAAIALTLGTVVLFKMKRDRYAWVTILPTLWLLACTLTAGWQKLFDADPRVSFLAHANKYNAAIDQGQVLAPAKSLTEMGRVVMNDYINAGLCAIFMFVVVSIVVFGVKSVRRARAENKPTSRETPYEPLPMPAGAD
jgi:carbon starvation protein